MLHLWYGTWLLAAAFPWVFLLRATQYQRVGLALVSIGAFAAGIALWQSEWFFRGERVSLFLFPILAFLVSLVIAVVIEEVRAPFQRWFFGIQSAIVIVASPFILFALAFRPGPSTEPVLKANLPNGYCYTVSLDGMAWSGDFVTTRVVRISPWLPGLEQPVAESTIRLANGAVGGVSEIEVVAQTYQAAGDLSVRHLGEEIDRVIYGD
ncbi:MAG: hypothetical protein AAGI52_13830 [Bacteroidota bacterium]